jgi:hypothetical protein
MKGHEVPRKSVIPVAACFQEPAKLVDEVRASLFPFMASAVLRYAKTVIPLRFEPPLVCSLHAAHVVVSQSAHRVPERRLRIVAGKSVSSEFTDKVMKAELPDT